MPLTNSVQTAAFDQNTLDDFTRALRGIGFIIEQGRTIIDDITYDYHAKWNNAPVGDGIYYKFTESQYTPLYHYMYTSIQTVTGSTYDENLIAQLQETYPDTFEILSTDDYYSSSYITFALSKDNRNLQFTFTSSNNTITYGKEGFVGYIFGTQDNSPGYTATNYRINFDNRAAFPYNIGNASYKIPYVSLKNGGIVILALDYWESESRFRSSDSALPMIYMPADNSKEFWRTVFWDTNYHRPYFTYYSGDSIVQAGTATGSSYVSDSGLTVLNPLYCLSSMVPFDVNSFRAGIWDTTIKAESYINFNAVPETKIFEVRYLNMPEEYSMGMIYTDSNNNEYYIFKVNSIYYAVKL